MVWNSTQSALYRAVDAHNGGESERKSTAEKNVRKNAQKTQDFRRGNNEKIHNENYPRNECRGCPKCAPGDPVSRIMSDGDMLLIAGLIYILWRENADRKLILALAIVLLG